MGGLRHASDKRVGIVIELPVLTFQKFSRRQVSIESTRFDEMCLIAIAVVECAIQNIAFCQ